MQLQLRFSGFAESYKTTLVGMERGRYLICSAPVLPGLWAVLNAPDQTTVRYLCEGVVYGFKCTLLTALAKPFQLLVLSYPEKIETVNLRQHQRIPCLIPAKAKMGQTGWDGALLDLSLSGCCFVWDAPQDAEAAVSSGDEMEISYRMPGLSGEKPGLQNQSDEREEVRQPGNCRWFVRRSQRGCVKGDPDLSGNCAEVALLRAERTQNMVPMLRILALTDQLGLAVPPFE